MFLILLLLQIGRRGKADYIFGRLQLVFLLSFSYALIFSADVRFGICIAAETVLTYIIGRNIKNSQKILTGGITLLLLMLGYFKYCEFFMNSFRGLLGADAIALDIILPMWISFYTFAAISYLIDVYRGKYEPEKNLMNFALFIAFFPKLTVGSIVIGDCFLPQAKEYRGIKAEGVEAGVQILVFGLFKKNGAV